MKCFYSKQWWLLGLVSLVGFSSLQAQYATNLTVTDSNNVTLAQNIDRNGSQLLTAFNTAFFAKKLPALNFGGITKKDRETICTIWELTPFRCLETEIIERLYNTSSGYQVRNIPVFLEGVPEEDAERDIVINFDKAGNVSDIYFAVEAEDYRKILYGENNEVTDLRKRQIILDFVENYRTAHNRKDLAFIKKVFSNDALIITGKVIQSKPSEMNNFLSKPQIEYQVKSKEEYITGLANVFKRNQWLNIKFDEMEVQVHPKYKHIYGVTFKQYWNTSGYSDEGYVFLNMDFKDENNPLIKVRTWQPAKYANGKDIDPDDIFHLGSFDIF